ncbi:hypothetical protein AAG906_022849 [Vitis piasezkii]
MWNAKFSHNLDQLASKAISSSFQLQIVHGLKCWILDFKIFKMLVNVQNPCFNLTVPIQERERWALYSSHSTNGDRPSVVLMKVVVHQYITRLHSLGVPVIKGCGDALFYLNKWTTYQRS